MNEQEKYMKTYKSCVLNSRALDTSPIPSSVFYDVEEKMKEKTLWDHSERLTISFALVNQLFLSYPYL